MTDSAETGNNDNVQAAEYVIGVLALDERLGAEARMRTDSEFAALVAFWRKQLSFFDQDYGALSPPERVKRQIDRRLFAEHKPRCRASLWWAFATALVAIVFVVSWALAPAGPDFRANLKSEETPYQFSLEIGPDGTLANVTQLAGTLPSGRVFELWVLPPRSAPVSLGVFAESAALPLVDNVQTAKGTAFAVSLEPAGGSPTGAPTGPILAIGELEDV